MAKKITTATKLKRAQATIRRLRNNIKAMTETLEGERCRIDRFLDRQRRRGTSIANEYKLRPWLTDAALARKFKANVRYVQRVLDQEIGPDRHRMLLRAGRPAVAGDFGMMEAVHGSGLALAVPPAIRGIYRLEAERNHVSIPEIFAMRHVTGFSAYDY